MAVNIGGIFGSFGGAVSDLFGAEGSKYTAQGDFEAAVDYANAADIALKNKSISEQSTAIQLAQTNRKIFQTIGSEQAGLAGGNVSGGSAGDLLRMSTQQGGLAKAVVTQQGAINALGFQQQAEGLYAAESSATAAGNAALQASEGQMWGAGLNLLGGVAGIAALFL